MAGKTTACTAAHVIPPMTDPLGKHWQQPNAAAILVDDKHAIMTAREFDQLAEYSRSTPSGVYPGKMWKAITRDGVPYLCWFGLVPGRDDLCSNNSREILLADAAMEADHG